MALPTTKAVIFLPIQGVTPPMLTPVTTTLSAGSYVVGAAQTTVERDAVFRLRYEVYVAEQGKAYTTVDHSSRSFREDLDDEGVILSIQEDRRLVATVRVNWLPSERLVAHYSEVLQFDLFDRIEPSRICVCSRLAVEPGQRSMGRCAALLESLYRIAAERQTQICLMTCRRSVLPLFQKYGHREYGPPFQDPVLGARHRLALALDDLLHLDACGSPFAALARSLGVSPAARPWLDELFGSPTSVPRPGAIGVTR